MTFKEQITITILTIIFSGVFSTSISFVLNKRKDEIFYKKKKLEELHTYLSKYTIQIISTLMIYHDAMNGKISLNDANKLFIDTTKNDENQMLNIQMIIDLYFRCFEDDINALNKLRATGFVIQNEFKAMYSTGILHNDELSNKIIDICNNINRWNTIFQGKIQNEINKKW